ncbi:MAG: hypothetical protein ABJG41_16910 [Cyclobacteriaceae bacterium]
MKNSIGILFITLTITFSCQPNKHLEEKLIQCQAKVDSLNSQIVTIEQSLKLAKKEATASASQYLKLKTLYDEMSNEKSK